MTDPTTPPTDDSRTSGADTPPAPAAPPAYDASPYVAPSAPAYDTGSYETAPYAPAAPPAYTPPAYPPAAYGAPAASPYGSAQPLQTSPGAPPVMPYGYGYPTRKTNGLAIASMVLSILGFIWVLPFVGSLAGAIMGHVSLGQIKRTGEGGRGMALAGVIVGWIGLGFMILGILFFVFVIFASGGSSSTYGYGA